MDRIGDSDFSRALSRLAAGVVIVAALCFLLPLTVSSYVETTFIDKQNNAGECAVIFRDKLLLNVLVTVVAAAGLYLLSRWADGIPLRRIEAVLLLWTAALGLAFILTTKISTPWYTDSFELLRAAKAAAENDFSALEGYSLDVYFVRYPFQLGFVLYVELFLRAVTAVVPTMPEGYYFLALQGVNLLWLLLAYHALIRLSVLLLDGERSGKRTALLLFLCLPAVLSCTFLYGNIPAFACGTAALWCFASFLRERRWRDGVLTALLLALAVVLKLNLLIFFAAVLILWCLDLLRRFELRSLVCFVLCIVTVLGVRSVPQSIYERRSGRSFGDGIPMLAWMAMGFCEGHAGPGWYKEDNTVTAFYKSGNDSAATKEHARRVLSERLGDFTDDPAAALEFFSTKLVTQWNEPSYESIWLNQVHESYGEKGALYGLFCDRGEKGTLAFMNQVQQLVFLGTLSALLRLWRRKDVNACLPIVVLLGGLLYHLLFEAKSQYALPYYILLFPMAAYGWDGALEKLFAGRKKRHE